MVKNGIERQTSTAKVLKIIYSKGRERCQCVKKKRRFFMINFRTDLATERREIYRKANKIENEIPGVETRRI